jgi:hypothetical protein
MDDADTDAWTAWRDRVAAADPSGADAALLAFVDEAAQWCSVRRARWVASYCRRAFDEGEAVPWPAALAQRVVLPELARGVRDGQPGCARWMAQVPHALDEHRAAAGLPGRGGWREQLLELAIRSDPSDDRARRLLVAHLRAELDWALEGGARARRAGPQWVADRALRVAGLAADLGEACPDDVDRWLRTAAIWAAARTIR